MSGAPLIKLIFLFALCGVLPPLCHGQGSPPWNNDLYIARSADGKTFGSPTVVVDSAGVPSVLRWKGDTLIAVFQWFRQPNPSPSWDRVAVAFSHDDGWTWTEAVPIRMVGLPAGYQRPFDPTLVVSGADSLRLYFSSSEKMPAMGPDSSINTYSAVSTDGIEYHFESGARVDHPSNRIIDPAVIFFNSIWQLTAPVGSPQQGAYRYISRDGLHFEAAGHIPSDNMHNWTGNFVAAGVSELRFYGSGPTIWYSSSEDGNSWSGYIPTNIQGGDPGVVKLLDGSYLMLFVGRPNASSVDAANVKPAALGVYPNPTSGMITLDADERLLGLPFLLCDPSGRTVLSGVLDAGTSRIDLGSLSSGSYLFHGGDATVRTIRILRK
jgi:hypothetical protein